ncbi:hypothetical protein C2S51_015731 [Perilla frutescens var. frutescens]|nr:hypothetical protein C2S51_015731 [Perilla frutescens var. frutescens]
MADTNNTIGSVPNEIQSNEGQIVGHVASVDCSIPGESSPPKVDLENEVGKRKLTSVVWQHFKKKKINGVDKAECNYCKKKLVGSSKNGTKHLHGHFKICPLRAHRDIKQSILNPTKKKDGGTVLGTYTFDQENSRQQLARMIILHEYPMNMVEHEGFINFVNSIQPLFSQVSRTTIRKDIFKIYEVEKEKTMNCLSANSGRIAITTNMWTSNDQKRGYMVVTAHYIDDTWTLHSRIIRFIYVPSPHTIEALSKVLMQCLIE